MHSNQQNNSNKHPPPNKQIPAASLFFCSFFAITYTDRLVHKHTQKKKKNNRKTSSKESERKCVSVCVCVQVRWCVFGEPDRTAARNSAVCSTAGVHAIAFWGSSLYFCSVGGGWRGEGVVGKKECRVEEECEIEVAARGQLSDGWPYAAASLSTVACYGGR